MYYFICLLSSSECLCLCCYQYCGNNTFLHTLYSKEHGWTWIHGWTWVLVLTLISLVTLGNTFNLSEL